jgi:hypothetical protein
MAETNIDYEKLSIPELQALIAGESGNAPQAAAAPQAGGIRIMPTDIPKVEPPSFGAGVGRGMMDFYQGVKQKYLNIKNPEEAKAYTDQVNQEIANYEKARQAAVPTIPASQKTLADVGKEPEGPGFDYARVLGNIATPASLVPQTRAVGLVPRAMSGAAAGGLSGYANFNPENTNESSLIRAATGAAGGGVVNAAIPYAAAGATHLMQGTKNTLADALRQFKVDLTPDINVKTNVRLMLQDHGFDFNNLSSSMQKSLLDDAKTQLVVTGKLDPAALMRKADIESIAGEGSATSAQVTRNPAQWTTERNLQKYEVSSRDAQKGGSIPLTERYIQQDTAAKNFADKLISQITGLPPAKRTETPYQASEAVIQSIQKQDQEYKEIVNNLYDVYKSHNAINITVPPTKLAEAAGKILEEHEITQIPPAVIKRLNDFGLLGGKQTKLFTLQEAENFNKLINNVNIGATGPGTAGGLSLSLIKKALTESILDIPEEGATKALLNARKAAKARFDAQETGLGVSAAISDVAPDKFFNKYVLNGDVRDIKALKTSLDKSPEGADAWSNLKSETFKWAYNKATSNGDKEFNGIQFRKALDSIGKDRLSELFNADELTQINTLKRGVLAMTAEPPFAAPSRSNTAPQLLADLLSLGNKVPGINLMTKPIQSEITTSANEELIRKALSGRDIGTPARDQAQAALREKIAKLLSIPNVGAPTNSIMQQYRK